VKLSEGEANVFLVAISFKVVEEEIEKWNWTGADLYKALNGPL
jgi:hypothetical protein